MTNYAHGDVHTILSTRGRVEIPEIPPSPGTKFIMSVRNLDPSLAANMWTIGASEVLHRIPPNYDGVLLDNIPWEHISGGFEAQGIGGSLSLNIVLMSVDPPRPTPTVISEEPSLLGFEEGAVPDDNRDVEVVVV